jgi:hypothetical protein
LNETNNYLINIRKADYREKWSSHLNKRNNLGILQFALKSQNELRDVWRALKEIKTEHTSTKVVETDSTKYTGFHTLLLVTVNE